MIKNYTQLLSNLEKISKLKDSLAEKKDDPISKASKAQSLSLISDLEKEISSFFEKGIVLKNSGVVSLSGDTFNLFLFLARKNQKGRGVCSKKIRTKKKIVQKEINNIIRSYLDSHR